MIDLTNPPEISDPSQITSNTLPTTRADGSALQIGDRWYRPSTGKEGFWNGTIFLSTNEKTLSGTQRQGSNTGDWRDMVLRTGGEEQRFMITQVIFDYFQTVANYRFRLYLMPVGADTPSTTVFDANLLVANARTLLVSAPNLIVVGGMQSQITSQMFRLDGTSSTFNFNYNISYREVLI